MDEKKIESGFKLLSVVLLESSFKREGNIDFSVRLDNQVEINTGYNLSNNNSINCFVEVNFKSLFEGKIAAQSNIKMAGVFEKMGESEIDVDAFGKINAPAIIYPFIREHLGTLTMKSGLTPFLLPPLNFVALSKSSVK